MTRAASEGWKRGDNDGGGLADKNYPFKVEKRYKSAVKLSNGAPIGPAARLCAAITIIGK